MSSLPQHPSRGDCPCPICRRGQLSPLTLMEAIGCDNCGHLFEVQHQPQRDRVSLRAIDQSPPPTWRWTGRGWQPTGREDVKISLETWIAAVCFTLVPTAIVATAAYIFPPLPGSGWSAFPLIWTGLTFLCHGSCVITLLMEYYQVPLSSYFRLRPFQ
ncbi:hypothetical protein [Sodalinema gerasimenkoae]|uniref:hypothetical protein n=1 Tax=Sodalinema gerasimenkoae TaxID=2862348 RepID=UPI00135C8238|nr:hypothetical protein [Sodalinema gerasimenkoae]